MKYDFWALFEHFYFTKVIEMNSFSGSTIFWGLFGEYQPFNLNYCYCKGLSSGYPKIGQTYMKYDFWALLIIFPVGKLEMNAFSGITIFWRLLGEYLPLNVPHQ